MTIDVPDDILKRAGLTAQDCLVELAVHLYAERRLPLAEALRLSALSRADFEKARADRDISLYTVQDLRDDVKAVGELRNR